MSKLAYNRICYVDIGGGKPYDYYLKNGFKVDNWTRIRGLDVKFDIHHYAASAEGTANISILGLSYQRISQLASWAGSATAYSKCWIIRLYAGYGENEKSVDKIFEGEILNAMPTTPPDVWLNIEARSHYGKRLQCMTGDVNVIEGSVVSAKADENGMVDVTECLSLLVGLLNANHNLNDPTALDMIEKSSAVPKSKITLPSFPTASTNNDVCRKIKDICDSYNITYQIKIGDDGFDMYEFWPMYWPDGFELQKSTMQINSSTGMVGIPRMKYEGIEVTTLMNNMETDMLLGYFNVKSRFAFPGMYGQKGGLVEASEGNDISECLYKIISIRYHGHLRGNEWYATYYGTRYIYDSDRPK